MGMGAGSTIEKCEQEKTACVKKSTRNVIRARGGEMATGCQHWEAVASGGVSGELKVAEPHAEGAAATPARANHHLARMRAHVARPHCLL